MIIDVNVNLSRWPFRRTPCDEPQRLVAALREGGVVQAWAGTLDGLFHRDLGGANARLVEECRRWGRDLLLPFGCVNPMLPDWREDLRRGRQDYRMPGIRLHPNYHGYRLEDTVFAEVLQEAGRQGLIVQVALRMDDVRVQHPLMRVANVDPAPMVKVLAALPQLPVVILNVTRTTSEGHLKQLAALPNVYFDYAMWEGIGGVAALVKAVSAERVLFGSHLPLFPLPSSLLKLRESELTPGQVEGIRHGNARRILQLRPQQRGQVGFSE
jgi:predicted TIM-barrel fold metal-dependent hydrolase